MHFHHDNPHPSDRLLANDTLTAGSSISSPNGRYQLIFQEDSNLVLYKVHHSDRLEALWASDTYSEHHHSHRSVVLQGDGNLVMYDSRGEALWSSGSYGYGAGEPYLVVQNDGNVCLYDREVRGCHWTTDTYQG